MKNFQIKIFIYFLGIFINFNILISRDDIDTLSNSDFIEFLNFLYQSKDIQVNNNYLNFAYGYSNLFSKYNFQEKLSRGYNLKVEYGFLRISPTDDNLISYLASEGAYLGNISSHLKPKSWKNEGLLFDAWTFGFNYKNGYGYNLNDDFQIFLLHYGSVDWKKIDFETFSSNETINKNLLAYNRDFRFGTSYESEIRAIISNLLMLQFIYSESHLFRRHLFGLWSVSAIGELMLQRGIDILSAELIESIPHFQPILNLAIKTFLSVIIYKQRQRNSYFPFNSESPLRFENIRLSVGISF
ncbi:MAG: hypothetical protein N2319_01680 [Candidatus Kapabacteria bacterium]|nr:hypothetical protein [Candidatus Kapabacteria bacterium]